MASKRDDEGERNGDRGSLHDREDMFEKAVLKLLPRTDYPMAVGGFMLATIGATVLIVLTFDSFNLRMPMEAAGNAVTFACFAVAFVGFMLLHKATKGDWL